MSFLLPRWLIVWLFAAGVLIGAQDGLAGGLNREVVVDDEIVRLGELFDGVAVSQADKAVARAPSPGRQVTVSRRWLAKMARTHGLSSVREENFEPITVRRLGARIEAGEISDLVAEALSRQTGLDNIEVRLDGGAAALVIAGSDAPSLRLEDLRYKAADGRFTATLLAEADGSIREQRSLSGKAVALVDVPVLIRAVQGGSNIRQADLTAISVTADALAPNVMTDTSDLVGMTAERSLRAGKPILRHEVSEPLLVKRGKPVIMQFKFGTLVISARGRALTDGARGEIVRVLNTDSGRTVEAVAVGPDTVEALGSNAADAQSAALAR